MYKLVVRLVVREVLNRSNQIKSK